MEKTCTQCGKTLPVGEFYANYRMSSGTVNQCKECVRKRTRDGRAAKLDYYRQYDRMRGNRQQTGYQAKYRARNPDRYKAHNALNNALRAGLVDRLPCQVCGNMRSHAHHPAYDLPLAVVWLCAAHHKECHK